MSELHAYQIGKLFYRYAYGIDAGDFGGVAEMFKNASIHGGQGELLAKGCDQIEKFYEQIIIIYPDTGTPKTQHVVSNILIESETKDLVTARANYSVFQKLKNGKIEAIICGQYHSSFVPGENGWEFSQHQTQALMVGDMSNHLKLSIKDISERSKP